ncbi:MAG: MBL fold metallo-hydrolase [Christensenellales bacterium]
MREAKRMPAALFMSFLLAAAMALGGCSASPEGITPEPEQTPPQILQDNAADKTTEQHTEKPGEAQTQPPEEAESPLKLTYLGHAAFLLEGAVSVLMDSYQPDLGTYGKIELSADIVTVTHEHSDHNYAGGGGEDAVVLKGLTPAGDWNEVDYQLEGLRIYTVGGTLHGRNLGKNGIFVIETPHLRLAHLGDLGHTLDGQALAEIGEVDILIVPVGGYYTMPAEEALEVIGQIAPGAAIPVHYRTPHNTGSPIGTLETFLDLEMPYKVEQKGAALTLTGGDMPPQTEIWTMDYERP